MASVLHLEQVEKKCCLLLIWRYNEGFKKLEETIDPKIVQLLMLEFLEYSIRDDARKLQILE